MFQERLRTLSEHIQTVRSIISTNKKLRELLFQRTEVDDLSIHENTEIASLKKIVPSLNNWQIYDHCSVVTRLYAIYENFVESIITDWILQLPKLFPNYSDLAEEIRSTHQIGVAQLLQELKKKKSRFERLSVEDAIRGLFLGVSNSKERYDMIPEAFLLHDQNLRKAALEKLFADAGIQKAWNWIERHRDMKRFIEEVPGNQNTAEGELKRLIEYRNESAHGGVVTNFLDPNTLIELCDFIEALCGAFAELVTYQIVDRQKSIGQLKQIGKITEWFKKPNAGIAVINNSSLSIGEQLFLVNQNLAYCQSAIVRSLQVDSVSREAIQVTEEMELGLQFDVLARKNLLIYTAIAPN
jgi:hypothetical protein